MFTGTVISQAPGANADVDPDKDHVTLTVSKGPKQVQMPDLIGKKQDKAAKMLESAGLKLDPNIQQEASYTVPKGTVIAQWPYDPGQLADPDEKIQITVSSGYPADAIKYTYNVPVLPEEEGKNTKVRIEYADASTNGETKEWGTKNINSMQVFPVEVVVGPSKDATVRVVRNGQLFDTYTVYYTDVKNGTVPDIDIVLPNNTGDEQDIPENPADENKGGDETTGMTPPGWKHGNPGKGNKKKNENVIYQQNH